MFQERPKLKKDMNIQDLLEFHWMKTELKEFCRILGISTAGGKMEILQRIENFLKNGCMENKFSKPKNHFSSPCLNQSLNINTLIGENFRCTREIRNFFEEKVDKKFHFSVALQKFIKLNPSMTFQHIADEWIRLKSLKNLGKKNFIDVQFEYNQFTRDFFLDPQNKGKSRKDCIHAWKEIRSIRGDRKYKSKIKKG